MNIETKAIEKWIGDARAAGIIGPEGFEAAAAADGKAEALLYPGSVKQHDGAVFAVAFRRGPLRVDIAARAAETRT